MADQKFKAKVKDWRLDVVGADQKDVVKVIFETDDHKEYTYTGWLTDEKGVQRSVQALSVCGFKGSDLASLGSGAFGGALEVGREVRITVEEKASKTSDRTYPQVKFVDPLTGPDKFEKAYDKQAQAERLTRLKADVMAAQPKKSEAKMTADDDLGL